MEEEIIYRGVVPNNGYLTTPFCFQIIEKVIEDQKVQIKPLTDWHTCREYVTLAMRHLKMKSISSQANLLITAGKVAARTNIEFMHKVIAGWKWAREFEMFHEWPTSRLNILSSEGGALYWVVGSRKWTKSPYIFSLYTLLLRIGTVDSLRDLDPDKLSHKDLIGRAFEKLSTLDYAKLGPNERQILLTIPYWDILMSKYLDLFSSKSQKWHWTPNRFESVTHTRTEGLLKLIKGQANHLEMRQKFDEILDQCKEGQCHTLTAKAVPTGASS